MEDNESGRLFRSACLHFDYLSHTLQSQQAPQAGGAGMAPPMPGAAMEEPPALPPMERARNALEHGWPADDKALAVWLDKLYAGEWAPMLQRAAALPTGPFDDIHNMTLLTSIPATQPARELGVVLAARGLQRQAAGDDEAYVENLRIGLALSRSLRDHTPTVDLIVGRVVEGVLIGGLDRWLEKLHGRSDLIRQALALLSHHLDETAADSKDQELVQDLITQNTVEYPLPLLDMYLSAGNRGVDDPLIREETQWIATSWLVPWERARQARIVKVALEGDKNQRDLLFTRLAGPNSSILHLRRDFPTTPMQLATARAMQLKLALRWFQADTGKPAENLDELVPKYLPSIPLDPYDGEPFRYRLSRGEEIVLPLEPNTALPPAAPLTRKIPPGQGVLWSADKDRVFLVPLPPKAK